MDNSIDQTARKQPPRDETFYLSWGMILGAVAGLVVGLSVKHWAGGTLWGAFAGAVIGALLDRNRR
jgi:uncharacterized membrane protein